MEEADTGEAIAYELIGNSLLAWATAVAVFVGVWLVLTVAHRVIRNRVAMLAASREDVVALHVADAAVGATKGWFMFLLAVLVASRFLDWPAGVGELIRHVLAAALVFQAGFWGTAALGAFLERRRKHDLTHDPGAVAALDFLAFVLRIVIWAIVILVVLETSDIPVTPLIAGLGVGGIAVALAAQNILGDLFASLSIVLDKPFEVGDFIVVDDKSGTVERVGLKTSRIRALSGEQLVFSNSDLLSARIQNFKRMFERRVVFTLRVSYATPRHLVAEVPRIIRGAIEEQDNTRFDRAHFATYGDDALVFEAVYYMTVPDYNPYMDTQQAINLRIHEEFEKRGIEFAFPTRTVLLQQTSQQAAAQ